MELETINQEDFIELTKTEKVNHVFHSGKEILERTKGDYIINLYALNGFFVEVWYKKPENKIEKIEACPIDQVIARYEKEIELTQLF